jgi:tetrahydrodipicolinate N-acetyltransferase
MRFARALRWHVNAAIGSARRAGQAIADALRSPRAVLAHGAGVAIPRPERVEFGDGVAIGSGSALLCGEEPARIRLGDGVTIGHWVHIAAEAGVTVGARVHIHDLAAVTDTWRPIDPEGRTPPTGPCPAAVPIVIEDDVVIGPLAIVGPGVHIGSGARIAAAAIVMDDVEPGGRR